MRLWCLHRLRLVKLHCLIILDVWTFIYFIDDFLYCYFCSNPSSKDVNQSITLLTRLLLNFKVSYGFSCQKLVAIFCQLLLVHQNVFVLFRGLMFLKTIVTDFLLTLKICLKSCRKGWWSFFSPSKWLTCKFKTIKRDNDKGWKSCSSRGSSSCKSPTKGVYVLIFYWNHESQWSGMHRLCDCCAIIVLLNELHVSFLPNFLKLHSTVSWRRQGTCCCFCFCFSKGKTSSICKSSFPEE